MRLDGVALRDGTDRTGGPIDVDALEQCRRDHPMTACHALAAYGRTCKHCRRVPR
jgi:hypothetical protein